ncbi:ATP-dependent zinc metalloprotease FtsH [Thermoleophilia bacterium SCSIO 60948]|nr:ATP-dependent zinc metalloprotease FtsH [Thermoleophilia bacterium SCSIO 60948]
MTAATPPPGFLGFDSYDSFIDNLLIPWSPILLIIVIGFFMWKTLKLMPRTKPQEISATSKTAIRWTDVEGVDETKDELQEVVDFLSDPKRFKRLGAKVPKGILLHGPPGTGKTMLAKAVASESGATFISQSASNFIEMFAGLGAARIRRLFKEAADRAPAIIFIDELDAVGAERGSDISGERDQTLNQLLVEMDGFDSRDDVVVMAASNLLEKLDPALLRPGRFDRQVFVPPPDMHGRRAILEVHTKGKPLGQDVDLERTARYAAGLTGADLANLANEAAILAGRNKREFVAQADFDDAFERVVAGLQSRKVITDHEKRVIAWHEAGHALISELLPSVDKVTKVSIVPRGKALGYTLNLPQEDRYLKTREELVDYMTVLLGGRVAEQITFGRVTTGASDDLRRVTEIARSMVVDYAMGTQIRAHGVSRDDLGISEALRRTRDEEIQAVAEEAFRAAYALLSEHRDLLDGIAERLLETEAIERDEIVELMRDRGNDRPPEAEWVRGENRTAALAAREPDEEPPGAK